MLKKEIVNVLEGCTCEVEELPGLPGSTAKGYVTTNECDVCKEANRINRIKTDKERRIQEILQELNSLDLKAIRPLIDKEDTIIAEIKTQKEVLRTELNTLKGN